MTIFQECIILTSFYTCFAFLPSQVTLPIPMDLSLGKVTIKPCGRWIPKVEAHYLAAPPRIQGSTGKNPNKKPIKFDFQDVLI